MTTKRKWVNRGLGIVITIFILINIVAIFHSYKFTHFISNDSAKTRDAKQLTIGQKITTLILGVSNPRPQNKNIPSVVYETVHLNSNRTIECWNIRVENPKGVVVLFHGYGGEKSSMLDKSNIFNELGYSNFLVDFMGSGGSEGDQTTIGFLESEQVNTCYEYLSKKVEKNIYLFGTSMGAVAIMKSIKDYQLKPKGIIIECPFGSMYQTVCARFKTMNTPTFPMAGLLVFWGGVQNGFWAFSHNPINYAKAITCPTLLLYGAKDEKVSKEEIIGIIKNLSGQKSLKVYREAGHENYLIKYKQEWTKDIQTFLKQ